MREIANLAHKAGMEELEEHDTDELLASLGEELSNEDLMAIKQVREEEEAAAKVEPEP